MDKHSPTPWYRDGHWGRRQFGDEEYVSEEVFEAIRPENADFIVRAVNAHEELVEALKLAQRDHERIEPHHADLCDLCRVIKDAIAKADG